MIYSYLDKNVKVSTLKSAYVAGLLPKAPVHLFSSSMTLTNVNDASPGWMYYNSSQIENAPASRTLIITFSSSNGWKIQFAADADTEKLYFRLYIFNAWTSWKSL